MPKGHCFETDLRDQAGYRQK